MPGGRGKAEGACLDWRSPGLPSIPMTFELLSGNLPKRTTRWHLSGADRESHSPHTPANRNSQAVCLRQWACFRGRGGVLASVQTARLRTLFSPHPKHAECRPVPTRPGCQRGIIRLLGAARPQSPRRDLGAGGGWPWAAPSWKPPQCPGLLRPTSSRAKAEEWHERRNPGRWQAEVR